MEMVRTILTPIAIKDFDEILEMYAEPDTFRYIEPAQNRTRQEHIDFLESRVAQVNNKNGYHWVARDKTNKEFLGLMNLNLIRNSAKMQIGFQLKRKFWNKGLASELTRRILDFGMQDAGLKVIYGVFSKDNIASRRIFLKFAFEFEETMTLEGDKDPIEIWKYQPVITLNNN